MVTIMSRNINHERSGHPNCAQSPDLYEGVVNGKPFGVEISPTDAPVWTCADDDELSDDDKAEVLTKIND